MREVLIDPASIQRLANLLTPERAEAFEATAQHGRAMLEGRTVWNVNATSQGGGVAEMLQALLAYGRGAGVDTRWFVLAGDPEFFAITKRLHNMLHGSLGDGGELGPAERAHFLEVTHANEVELTELVQPNDVVLLHDPQTAGMVETFQARGAAVAWRCHIGTDFSTPVTDAGWALLRDLVEPADAFIFSRSQYAPPWVPADRLAIIPPSIDPFSAKNCDLPDADVAAALRRAGLVDIGADGGSVRFSRRDGSVGTLRPLNGLIDGGRPIPRDARVVMQVSRWDALKDMTGVLQGFATYIVDLPSDVHLLLAGPDVSGVTDDPEGALVLETCRVLWQGLPPASRDRVHLCSLPMDDVDENAHLVNALQRHASVVVQKSLVEGFGLTVTEPMWKARPVVASAVGGIYDQIEDGVSGLLLRDPTDLEDYVGSVKKLLDDPDLAHHVGSGAEDRVRDRFLGDRHLTQYVELFDQLAP